MLPFWLQRGHLWRGLEFLVESLRLGVASVAEMVEAIFARDWLLEDAMTDRALYIVEVNSLKYDGTDTSLATSSVSIK